MKIGVVFPQTEIGQDPAVIRDYAQAVESMGYTHILAFDSVVGRQPRPAGRLGQPVHVPARLPRALRALRVLRGGHAADRAGHRHRHPAPAPDGARRQAGGRGRRPLGRTACVWASESDGTPSSSRPSVRTSSNRGQAGRGAAGGHAAALDPGAGDLRRDGGTACPTPESIRCPCSGRFPSGWAAIARWSSAAWRVSPTAGSRCPASVRDRRARRRWIVSTASSARPGAIPPHSASRRAWPWRRSPVERAREGIAAWRAMRGITPPVRQHDGAGSSGPRGARENARALQEGRARVGSLRG